MRVSTGLQLTRSSWLADLDLRYVFEQDKVALGESTTPSYFLLDMSVHYDFLYEKRGLTIYAKLNNILDKEARNHVSTIRNLSPLPGRNATLGIQGTF